MDIVHIIIWTLKIPWYWFFFKITSMYTTNVCYEALMHNITPKDIENKET